MKNEEFATATESQDCNSVISSLDGTVAANSSSFTLHSSLLKKYWGYDSFRGIQREIIESISEGHDTLGLMPTGGGKSITFQVPALAKEGVCIVITPLIALMKDQVQHLRRRNIRAAAIYSGLSHDEILRTLENAVFGAVKLLYVSPERLASELFQQKLRHMKVSFICVDEAHCISQWGYDFRPSYLTIADIRRQLPDIPVLALTATATPEVVKDIQEKLRAPSNLPQRGEATEVPSLQKPPPFGKATGRRASLGNGEWGSLFNVFRMSFERKNLAYIVRDAMDKEQQLVHVYARSRQHTADYAALLTKAGISATYFHAGLDNAVKDQRQKDWQADRVRVMVATNAFGMGIDKPDVRCVIHMDCPDSIEAYFQEAGRAGRDGEKSYAVLLYNGHDKAKLQQRISDNFPETDYIRQVYDHLAYFYQIGVGSGYNATFEFPMERFCHSFRHFPVRAESALKILDRAGYIEFREEEENKARVMFILERDDLYRLRGNQPDEDKVIICLLRNYSGLFNQFNYIEESFIAQQTGLSQPQVYQILKSLDTKKILQFVPQKKTPYIRYTQRREDSKDLVFMPAVYDDLKSRYTQRIEKMLEYATTPNQCRSRMLLRYFGEDTDHECGHCDVCLQNHKA